MKRSRLNLLITAGPTVEDLDPVRFISNRATGSFGIELVNAALQAGHKVTLVHGPIGENVLARARCSPHLRTLSVRSAAEMYRAVMQHSKAAQIVIMNAAVADFTPLKTSCEKIKKTGSALMLKLVPTRDILKELGRRKKAAGYRLIGFALETGTGKTAAQRRASQITNALGKLERKNLDAIVLDTPQAMGAPGGDFTVIEREGALFEFKGLSKTRVAQFLVSLAERLATTAST